jgi:hypothetical protein
LLLATGKPRRVRVGLLLQPDLREQRTPALGWTRGSFFT